jgi:amino acid transporter
MPQSLIPLAVSLVIFVCTFAAAILGMALRRRLPDDHLTEDSKDVIQLIMGLIATMAALVLGLLIASASNSYQTQSDELQRASASVVELGGLLALYGPEANESRARLHEAVAAGTRKSSAKTVASPPSKGLPGIQPKLTPFTRASRGSRRARRPSAFFKRERLRSALRCAKRAPSWPSRPAAQSWFLWCGFRCCFWALAFLPELIRPLSLPS